MLQSIELENYLTIPHIKAIFDENLNIITGETGAGKSLILRSVDLFIQKKFPKDIKKIKDKNLIISLELKCGENHMNLKRVVDSKNHSTFYINNNKSNYDDIFKIFDDNIVFFGQRKYIELLGKKNHINYIDQYCISEKILSEYSDIFKNYKTIMKKLKDLEFLKEDLIEKKDFYQFKLDELDKIEIESDEEEFNLIEKIKISKETFANIESLNEIINEIDNNILKNLSKTIKDMDKIKSTLAESETLNIAYQNIEDVSFNLSKLLSTNTGSNIDYERSENQLFYVKELKRKYGATLDALLLEREKLRSNISDTSEIDIQINNMKKDVNILEDKLNNLANNISNKRKSNSVKLSKNILNHLNDLGMAKCNWIISFREADLNEKGIDDIEFLFSSSNEIPPDCLGKVASGGEISRIMLSIALEISNSLKSKTIIFDEPDIGLGGAVAEKLGHKISTLSCNSQVICISHLPQVASFANNHLLVKKINSEVNKINIAKLDKNEKINEIARMLSGEVLENEAFTLARKMIK